MLKAPIFEKLLCLLLMLCLCASCAQPAKSPFDDSGLLRYPGESAEEILLRAHEHDPAAVAVVFIGYQRGIGDFPKSELLAETWRLYAGQYGLKEPAYLATLISGVDWGHNQIPGVSLANEPEAIVGGRRWIDSMLRQVCPKIENSALARAFHAGGLFDAQQTCAELESIAGGPPGPLPPDKLEDFALDILDMQDVYYTTVAESYGMKGKAARETLEFSLLNYLNGDNERILYLIAESADNRKANGENFDDVDILLGFLSNEPDIAVIKSTWRAVAERRLADLLASRNDPGPQLELIRRAHAGAGEARRRMAVNYLNGSSGFPLSRQLGLQWSVLGAAQGDAVCMLLNAAHDAGTLSNGTAWAWASMAHERGGPVQELAAAMMFKLGQKTSAQERLDSLEYIRKLLELQP